ncbi:MAG: FtsX-like permease family protein [Lysobacter sp.]|nr:FtsX-like permease family protein [Lysobacter sp.]
MATKPDVLLAEVAQAWRNLICKPAFLLLAAGTLALGIATTAAVFSLLDQALLRPLPFAQADRLVTAGMKQDGDSNIGAPALYQRLQGAQGVAALGLVSAQPRSANLSGEGVAVVGTLLSADRGFLDTLALPMAVGRNFNAQEDRVDGVPAVILSHAFWMTRYGGNPAIAGQTLRVEGKPMTVVGVLPERFAWPQRFDLLAPMQLAADSSNTGTNEYIVARLNDGVAVSAFADQVDARIRAALPALRAQIGEDGFRYLQQQSYDARPLIGLYTGASGSTLWLFFGAALCVLLIAAINLTNLMVLRSIARSHDMAVRAAMGAPGLRLALPALAEGALVGLLGSAIGMLLAWLGLRLLGGLVPPEWLRGADVGFSAMGAAFALVAGAAVALLAAGLSVWRGRYAQLGRELVGGGRTGWSRGASRLGRVLVIAQTTVAVVLLIGAALFARSVLALASVPMGFQSASVATFSLSPVRESHPDLRAVEDLSRRLSERLQQLPGVERVAVSTNLPTGSQLNLPATLADGQTVSPQYRPVSPGFDQVFGIPVVSGRGLTAQDSAGAEPVCVVSAAFARQYLGAQPIGAVVRSLADADGALLAMRVVGVVGDVRQFGPDQPAPPVIYVPLAQMPPAIWTLLRDFAPLRFALRVRGEPGAFEAGIRAAVAEVESTQPIAEVLPMAAVVAATTSAQKLNLLLVGVFAAMALLLACVGLYAVMAVAVAARQHEFGIRAALGAPPRRLLRLVLKEAALQVAIGSLIGVAIAVSMSQVLQRFLFGVGAADPLAIGAVLLALSLAGLAASLPPALRAARVHPMRVLHAE